MSPEQLGPLLIEPTTSRLLCPLAGRVAHVPYRRSCGTELVGSRQPRVVQQTVLPLPTFGSSPTRKLTI